MRALLAALALALLPAAAQAGLPVVDLSAGMYLIRAEVADTDPARMQGLMYRKALADNAGMLFIFDESGRYCMWMKNTYVPLSVAFLDEHGAIINVEDMAPQTENSHCAARPARYALEMNRGWFAKRGIGAGIEIRGVGGR